MRISKEALAVLLAFTVPIVVEFRTVMEFVGIEVGVFESVLFGIAIVVLILAWAFWPEREEPPEGNPEDDDGHPNDGRPT